MELEASLAALENFLAHEQTTIDMMLLYAQRGFVEKTLTTALVSCGALEAYWQREQAVEVLLDTLDHIVQVVSEGYDEDWETETRTRFEELTRRARAAIEALVLEA